MKQTEEKAHRGDIDVEEEKQIIQVLLTRRSHKHQDSRVHQTHVHPKSSSQSRDPGRQNTKDVVTGDVECQSWQRWVVDSVLCF